MSCCGNSSSWAASASSSWSLTSLDRSYFILSYMIIGLVTAIFVFQVLFILSHSSKTRVLHKHFHYALFVGCTLMLTQYALLINVGHQGYYRVLGDAFYDLTAWMGAADAQHAHLSHS